MKKEITAAPFIQLAAVGVLGYLVWSNRFKIQEMLESQGIHTPWMKGSLSDVVRSGAAKLGGSLDSSY